MSDDDEDVDPFEPTKGVEGTIPRDGRGRPRIKQDDGLLTSYTRASNLAAPLDDKEGLILWSMEMMAAGLVARPALASGLAAAVRAKNHDLVRSLAKEAKQAGGAEDAAVLGTALHSFSEEVDDGRDIASFPEIHRADLAAYQRATSIFEVVAKEVFVVNDEWQAAGTFDRLLRFGGKLYIGDLKTGKVKFKELSMMVQLGTYAGGRLYDPVTGARTTFEERFGQDVERDRGIIIHLPVGQAAPTIYWLDLSKAADAVATGRRVRDMRNGNTKALTAFGDTETALANLSAEFSLEQIAEPLDEITIKIQDARSYDELGALWKQYSKNGWTVQHTEAAKTRRAQIA